MGLVLAPECTSKLNTLNYLHIQVLVQPFSVMLDGVSGNIPILVKEKLCAFLKTVNS